MFPMRRTVLLLVLTLTAGVVVIAIAAREDETGETASSCMSTPVAANAGTDVDPDLTLYQGTSSRPLTPSGWNSVQPSFSPDGEELAFIRSDTAWGDGGPLATELWVVPATGDPADDARSVVGEPGRRTDPAWSPIHDEIAYVEWSHSGGDRTLRVVNVDGTDDRALTVVENAYLHSPAWSPDGAEIAFIDQRLTAGKSDYVYEVRVIDRVGGHPRTVAEIPGASSLDWSPDGDEILVSTYDAEDGTLLLLHPTDGSTTTIAQDATMGVLADDSTVYFLDRVEQGSWQLALGTLESGRLDQRTRIGDDRIYAYGFFGLDPAPCGPDR
jgi:Tol biopolymer transport system component